MHLVEEGPAGRRVDLAVHVHGVDAAAPLLRWRSRHAGAELARPRHLRHPRREPRAAICPGGGVLPRPLLRVFEVLRFGRG
jgi:hypothetical protein